MGLYILGYIFLVQLNIVPELRLPKMVQFINEKLLGFFGIDNYTGIMMVAESFFAFRSYTTKNLAYSGQLLCMEEVLSQPNDEYPNAVVTIEDAIREFPAYLHNASEPFGPVYLTNVGEPDEAPLWLGNLEEFNSEYDFIIRVHLDAVSQDHKNYLSGIMEQFKIAGKNYIILNQNE
jgi:hypothetical protein